MKSLFGICLASLCLCLITTGCGESSQNDPRSAVDSFSTAYFNWRFKDAVPCVTPQSEKWLRFAASQVVEEDIDSLRAKKYAADITVDDLSNIDDSTVIATLTVKDYLAMDTIGAAPHRVTKRQFHIPIRLIDGYWRVHLSRLP